ncbi:MAG: hypothetical protein C3L25_01050 [Candidatus Sedimenticola endophacoides]|nr:MAG: hypothetical protein C3L26_01090 [Candidatus Sedimenticola endophacoides]PUE05385.1 MAG: hypothetical protein C3L25_01050 [Candidatus Sedimenticola endophacoides]
MLQCAGRSRDERRTVGAVTAVALASRFWGLGCPKIFHEVATLLLGDLYNGQPIHALADNHYGLILSRFPLQSRLKTGDSALHAEVTFPGSSVSVWNLHLPKSMASTQAQYDAVEQLVDQFICQPGPAIVAGDLNATQINHPYLAIAQHLDNAFEKAGFGMGFTFPSPARRMGWITPFMRIDHIFVSGHFQIHDVYVVDEAGGSDHYPVVAVVGMDNAIL